MAIKIASWTLLVAGLLIMAYSMYYSYNIFTAKMPVPELFKIEEKIAEKKAISANNVPTQADINNMLGEQLKSILPLDVIPKTLNLMSWSMLAGILIFGGFKVANLGINLIKK